ncbi:MAG: lysophospholipase [Thermomicrobiales bacterium]
MSVSASINSVDPVSGLPLRRFSFLGNTRLRLAATMRQPADRPRAIVVFAHGFTAFADAYAPVLHALVADGFLVYALDHRGHGASEGKRASLDRLDDMVEDFERLVALARAEQPALPIFTLGHSMGGLIVARHAQRFQEGLAGVIPVSAAFIVGEHISDATARLLVGASRLAPNLPVIGDDDIAPPRDERQRRRRVRNIFSYHGKVRLNMARELYLGGKAALEQAPSWELPILLQHGSDDPVTMPSGSETAFAQATSRDRTLELWPGRLHNLLTDDGWEEPVQGIIDWIGERTV